MYGKISINKNVRRELCFFFVSEKNTYKSCKLYAKEDKTSPQDEILPCVIGEFCVNFVICSQSKNFIDTTLCCIVKCLDLQCLFRPLQTNKSIHNGIYSILKYYFYPSCRSILQSIILQILQSIRIDYNIFFKIQTLQKNRLFVLLINSVAFNCFVSLYLNMLVYVP